MLTALNDGWREAEISRAFTQEGVQCRSLERRAALTTVLDQWMQHVCIVSSEDGALISNVSFKTQNECADRPLLLCLRAPSQLVDLMLLRSAGFDGLIDCELTGPWTLVQIVVQCFKVDVTRCDERLSHSHSQRPIVRNVSKDILSSVTASSKSATDGA